MDVLVVEDEPLVLEMVTEWLEEAGLQVAAAAHAEVALAVLNASGSGPPPPVLVTAVGLGLGRMDGITLVAELRRRWPGLAVVIMTDHDAKLARCAPPAPQERHLIKPFAPMALVQAVRELAAPVAASAR
jgi:CheY-like chemotaxis protein